MPEQNEAKEKIPSQQRQNDLDIIQKFGDTDASLVNLPEASPQLVNALLEELRGQVSKLDPDGRNKAVKEISERLREKVGREHLAVGLTLETGRFSGYQLQEILGQGAHGIVFLALNERGEKKVLKAVKPDTARGQTIEDAKNKLYAEAKGIDIIRLILEKNGKDSIVPSVWGHDEDSYTYPVFSMNYVEGQGIFMEDKYNYPPEVAVELLTKITETSYLLDEKRKEPHGEFEVNVPFRGAGGQGWTHDNAVAVYLERDRKASTIIIDEKTGKLKGIIDFSLPGYKLGELKDDPKFVPTHDFVKNLKRDSTINLGKMAKHLCGNNFENASAEFRSLVDKMIDGKFPDYATVYRDGIKKPETQ